MSKTRSLTRGEIGLAGFHRIIGYSSAVAALCLMGASITALYWFAGVIGLPTPAQVLVALAIEVMAASLAASATTAFRDGGRVDFTAWVGFAFFITIAAFANIMHVVTFIDTSVAPEWFGKGEFIVAACIFAAACPLGGTWGVHRFGWLRAHGADAEWSEDAQGRMVAPAQAARAPRAAAQPLRAAQPRATPAAPAAQPAAQEPRGPVRRASGGSPNVELQKAARVVYDRMLDEAPGTKPNAKMLQDEIDPDGNTHEATPRRWVNQWWAADPRNPDLELHAADPEPVDDLVIEARRRDSEDESGAA